MSYWGCTFYESRKPVQGIRWVWTDELREAYREAVLGRRK